MRIKEPFVLRKVGNDNLVVDPDQGTVDLSRVFSFNSTGAFLMEALKGRDFELSDVAELLIEEYGIDSMTAEQDSIKLIAQMKENKIITE